MLHFWHFFCFTSYEHCLLDFRECLLSFWYMLSYNSTVSVFINISLLSHEWNYFLRMIIDSTTHLTHMHVFPFSKSIIHHFHACSFAYSYTQYHHAFALMFMLNFSSVSLGNLVSESAFTKTRFHNLGEKGYVFLSRNAPFYLALSSRTFLHNFEG